MSVHKEKCEAIKRFMQGMIMEPWNDFNKDFDEFLKSAKQIDENNIGNLEENISYLFGEIDELVMDIPSGKVYTAEKFFATSGQIQPYDIKANIRESLEDKFSRIIKIGDKVDRSFGMAGSIIHLDKIVGFQLGTDRVIVSYQEEGKTKHQLYNAENV